MSDEFGAFLWRDGKIVRWEEATAHLSQVGHIGVASVFEGIRAYWSPDQSQLYVFRMQEHLERFLRSIKLVRLEQRFTQQDLSRAIIDLLRANEARCDTYVRPWIIPKTSIKKVMAPAGTEGEIAIITWPFPTRLLAGETIRVCVSSWRKIGDAVCPPRIKAFANYYNARMAEMEARSNGLDSAILLNDRDKVAEGCTATLAMIRGNKLITPTLASGVLEGITRDTFLRIAPELAAVEIEEREVDRTELYVADELFLMGTGREVWPIVEVDRIAIGNGKIGPISAQLERGYNDLVRGLRSDHSEWRAPVW